MSHFRGIKTQWDRDVEAGRDSAIAHDRLMDSPKWRKMNRETFINTLTQKHGYQFERAVACWKHELRDRIEINAEHMYDLLKMVRENIPGVPEVIREIEGVSPPTN